MASSAVDARQIGQLLLLDDVDVQLRVARVFAHDHAFVDLGARANENFAAKTGVLGYLVGQMMKASKSQANPAAVNEL